MVKRVKLLLMAGMSVMTVWLTALVTTDVKAVEKSEIISSVETSFAKNKFNKDICTDHTNYSDEQRAAAGCDEKRDAGSVGIALINVALTVVGILAVISIIIGGVNLTTSNGDAGKVAKAKNVILYGVIGLLIAMLAFAIVNFILTGVFG